MPERAEAGSAKLSRLFQQKVGMLFGTQKAPSSGFAQKKAPLFFGVFAVLPHEALLARCWLRYGCWFFVLTAFAQLMLDE